jgi:hypothetical protein
LIKEDNQSIKKRLLNQFRKTFMSISIELTAYGPKEILNTQEDVDEFSRDIKKALRDDMREKYDIRVEDEYVNVLKTTIFTLK